MFVVGVCSNTACYCSWMLGNAGGFLTSLCKRFLCRMGCLLNAMFLHKMGTQGTTVTPTC
ncbi:hypothetical protein FHS18_006700 [Paenibacillus phyllosphaerae]|uniref:Uncharacterized protein n=1 Tax=Paenibacillus phyllosphaerae TaxID=274593 RepID=A0A7W5B565_9BACL|nr:hypothetical protein [Paenibacillus phyllosphaerae]